MTERRGHDFSLRDTARNENNIRSGGNEVLFTRRFAILSAAGFCLSTCGEATSSFGQGIRYILTRNDGLPVSRSKIDSIPYASMAAKIGDGPEGIILLGQANGDRLVWFAGRKGVFVTERGRLVQTAGLPGNLLRSAYLDTDPLGTIINLNAQEKPASFRRLVDMTPPDNYEILISSTFHRDTTERIEIAELAFDTIVYVEKCRSKVLGWKFENRYWVGAQDGVIWQSQQYVHPTLPPVRLQVLKPYGG